VRVKPVCDAVYDCNIYLQAASRPNSPAGECLRLAENGIVRLYISHDILTEISEVLHRPKIRERFSDLTDKSIYLFLEKVRGFSHFVKRIPLKFKLPRDVDDEPYINLAARAKADYIVSRDNDLLDLMVDYTDEAKEFRQKFRPLKVIEPLEFLEEIRKLESESGAN